MATFIVLHRTQIDHPDGTFTIKRRHYSVDEIAELRETDPSAFITVPESHAAQVIRPQAQYQEVEDVVEDSAGNDESSAGENDGAAGAGPAGVELANNPPTPKRSRRAKRRPGARTSGNTSGNSQ